MLCLTAVCFHPASFDCRFFEAGACELRIGVYESFDTLCIYLESDALASPERNFWVKYRIAVVNQRHPDRTEWKDSAICTKTWNNSVLQFMKVIALQQQGSQLDVVHANNVSIPYFLYKLLSFTMSFHWQFPNSMFTEMLKADVARQDLSHSDF